MRIDTQKNGDLRVKWREKIRTQIYTRLHFLGIVDDDMVEPVANTAANAVISSGVLLDIIDAERDTIIENLRQLPSSQDTGRAEMIVLGYTPEQACQMYPSDNSNIFNFTVVNTGTDLSQFSDVTRQMVHDYMNGKK